MILQRIQLKCSWTLSHSDGTELGCLSIALAVGACGMGQ